MVLNNRKRSVSKGRRGHCIVEFALLSPWVFFLFAGALDWGFYAHGLISLQNAARVAADYTSTSSATAADATTACTIALGMLQDLPNVGSSVSSCSALPVKVTAVSGTGPDGAADTTVKVTYQINAVIPIPGLLSNQMTISRSVEMRVRS